MAWFDFGGLPHDEVLSSIELFAREVMPEVQALTQGLASETMSVPRDAAREAS